MNPYDLPHEVERESVHRAMERLAPAQRRIVRSYVRWVLYGPLSLTAWAEQTEVPRVALSLWRRPASQGGRYWGTEDSHDDDFRAAVKAYIAGWEALEQEIDRKSIEGAQRELRLGALGAARRMVSLVDSGENDRIRLDAAKAVLDHADVATAAKAAVGARVQVYLPSNGRDNDDSSTAAGAAGEIPLQPG